MKKAPVSNQGRRGFLLFRGAYHRKGGLLIHVVHANLVHGIVNCTVLVLLLWFAAKRCAGCVRELADYMLVCVETALISMIPRHRSVERLEHMFEDREIES